MIEKIEVHYESVLLDKPQEKAVQNEPELKKRFLLGNWSVDSVEDLLEVNCFTFQMILPHIEYEYLLHVLYDCSGNLKEYILYNTTDRYRKIIEFDLAAEAPSLDEINKAREAFVEISSNMITLLEKKEWQQLMLKLPANTLPLEPDLNSVFSLNEKRTKKWVEKIELEQLIHGIALDDEWHELYLQKVELLVKNKLEEYSEEELDKMLPQFKWQTEIARRLITYHAGFL